MSGLRTSSKSLGGIICVVASFQYSPILPPSEFDLAEWGVVIDDKPMTTKIMQDLWNPVWKHSYLDGRDCVAEKVMKILGVDRGPNASLGEDAAAMEANDIDVQSLVHIQKNQKSKLYCDGKGSILNSTLTVMVISCALLFILKNSTLNAMGVGSSALFFILK